MPKPSPHRIEKLQIASRIKYNAPEPIKKAKVVRMVKKEKPLPKENKKHELDWGKIKLWACR